MIAAIQLREYQRERKENQRISWATRTQAQYIAAGYMLGKNQENRALQQAEVLSIDDIEAILLGAEPGGGRGPRENGIGSYERFMQMVGQFETRGRQM